MGFKLLDYYDGSYIHLYTLCTVLGMYSEQIGDGKMSQEGI